MVLKELRAGRVKYGSKRITSIKVFTSGWSQSFYENNATGPLGRPVVCLVMQLGHREYLDMIPVVIALFIKEKLKILSRSKLRVHCIIET